MNKPFRLNKYNALERLIIQSLAVCDHVSGDLLCVWESSVGLCLPRSCWVVMRSHVDTVVDGDCRNATRRGKNPDLSERFHFWESVLRDPLFSGGLYIDFILFFYRSFFCGIFLSICYYPRSGAVEEAS